MKKYLVLIILLTAILFCGCGQELDVTVYNASGISSYAEQYVLIELRSGHVDMWKNADTYAKNESEIDENNSFTVKLKENDTIYVEAEGQYYVEDSGGNTSLVEFDTGTFSTTIYGGFLEAPSWYAACYKDSVTIYKK